MKGKFFLAGVPVLPRSTMEKSQFIHHRTKYQRAGSVCSHVFYLVPLSHVVSSTEDSLLRKHRRKDQLSLAGQASLTQNNMRLLE